ncbi:solute carrier family 2, facilitated glucose transporter member 1 [Hippocampus comes]|uniref:solute carrier family 2, facilitated glucose transporter member 1 n=1 Tax=Hippocampus comes TaxID=109280 RepID=UPI00094E7D5E|nr:PREDICTED: solute carrier family 2, facilitated glucose transporter member 1-like [Hippocampus comes]
MAPQECHLTALVLISVVAAILGSLQVGYHTGNVNAPAKIIEEFFNQTWRHRYNETMPDESLTLLWSLSVSIKDFGALLGCLGVKFVADNFGAVPVLINKGQEDEADAALLRLRGRPEPVQAELEEMKGEAAHIQASVGVLDFFRKRSYRQPIIIVLCVNLGSQLSGFNAIINYSTRMFQANFEEAKYLTLGVGAVNVIFTLVAFFLMERAGRRRLLLMGFIIIAMCNLLLTVIDSLVQTVPELGSFQVLLVFSLISAYELGPGPISWFIAGELFDQPGRSIGMAFASMLNWGGKFLLALLFPPIYKVIGGFSYLLFMAMALMGFAFTWFRVPETKGRTFDEIAEEFRGAENLPLHNKNGFNTFP